MGYLVYVRNKKTKAGQPGWWSDKKRLEVVTTYLTTGKKPITSAITGVPVETIKTWMRQDWWKKMVEEVQYEDNIELDDKLKKVMDKALDQVMDRLENGEFYYDPRTGKVKRVPAKLRDVNKVMTDMVDKRQLIKKTKQERTQPQQQQITADHLVQLAQAFAQFSTGKAPIEKIGPVYENDIQEKLVEENDNGLQDKEQGQDSS